MMFKALLQALWEEGGGVSMFDGVIPCDINILNFVIGVSATSYFALFTVYVGGEGLLKRHMGGWG